MNESTSGNAAALRPDPSDGLAASYRAAAQRMHGLAFVNPALDVEAVGFARWEGRWLGAIVTPWCINLVLAPHDPAAWLPLAPGAKRRYAFPAGDYEFIGAGDDVVGDFQVCSLFSPVLEFDDHATARLVAELAREALFDDANADVPAMPVGNLAPAAGDPARPGPVAQLKESLEAPLTKRDFLRGRFIGNDRGPDRG